MSGSYSDGSRPTFNSPISRIRRLQKRMEDLRALRKVYEAGLAPWERMVYRPDGIRETIRGIAKGNIIICEKEWVKCLRKKGELSGKIEEIDESLRALQEEMDGLLLELR